MERLQERIRLLLQWGALSILLIIILLLLIRLIGTKGQILIMTV